MRAIAVAVLATAVLSGPLAAQDTKPVPKDSVRLFIPGCATNYIFTAGPHIEDEMGSLPVPEGLHLRMNGPKKMMTELQAYKSSMIEIVGLVRKGQRISDGIGLGGGVGIVPGPALRDGSQPMAPIASPIQIDVESWHPVVGRCPSPKN